MNTTPTTTPNTIPADIADINSDLDELESIIGYINELISILEND